jgi:hypothetical protein
MTKPATVPVECGYRRRGREEGGKRGREEGGGGAKERTAGRAVRGAGGNEGYEQKEERVVRALCDANVEPYAVVIEVVHASVAYAAVL